MREPTIKNEHNLTMKDVKQLQIVDRSQVKEPLFWRNTSIDAWCISGATIQSEADSQFGAYSEFWIGIYDEEARSFEGKLKVACSAYGGMATYSFNKFFDPKDIENEHDMLVQEKLLETVNLLINKGILEKKKKSVA